MQTSIKSQATEFTPSIFSIAHIDISGAVAPKATEVKFQQKDTLVARILTGNVSTTKGFSKPSVIPIKMPSRMDRQRIMW